MVKSRLGKFEKFSPDLLLEDGQNLSSFGLDATIIHFPGHSKGSIGVLTSEGDLFCGDFLENTKEPVVNSLVDDPLQMKASMEKLKGMAVETVYPGHGRAFRIESILKTI